jgi:hypothetical protein
MKVIYIHTVAIGSGPTLTTESLGALVRPCVRVTRSGRTGRWSVAQRERPWHASGRTGDPAGRDVLQGCVVSVRALPRRSRPPGSAVGGVPRSCLSRSRGHGLGLISVAPGTGHCRPNPASTRSPSHQAPPGMRRSRRHRKWQRQSRRRCRTLVALVGAAVACRSVNYLSESSISTRGQVLATSSSSRTLHVVFAISTRPEASTQIVDQCVSRWGGSRRIPCL